MIDKLPVMVVPTFAWDDHPFLPFDVIEVTDKDTGAQEYAHLLADGTWIRGMLETSPLTGTNLSARIAGVAEPMEKN